MKIKILKILCFIPLTTVFILNAIAILMLEFVFIGICEIWKDYKKWYKDDFNLYGKKFN